MHIVGCLAQVINFTTGLLPSSNPRTGKTNDMTIDNIESSRVIVSYDDPFDSKSSHCNALHVTVVTIRIQTGIFLAGEVCNFGADVVPSHGPLRLEAVSMGDTGSHHDIKCFPIIPIS
jgi:hypothetical protein